MRDAEKSARGSECLADSWLGSTAVSQDGRSSTRSEAATLNLERTLTSVGQTCWEIQWWVWAQRLG